MQTYTIKEAANLTGLPESTLRYYETMGLIQDINRDISSGHRTYSEKDIDIISSIACLNATGMSIEKMKEYLSSISLSDHKFTIQLTLLKEQERKLSQEESSIILRKKYVKLKIKYWELLIKNDESWLEELKKEIKIVSEKLRLGEKKRAN